MKKLFLIMCVTLTIFSCSEKMKSSLIRNDLFFDNLNGEVKKTEVIPYTTESTGKADVIDSCCINILEYDNRGFRTRQVSTDIYGKEKNGQTYTRRHKNGRVKEIRSTENGKLSNILSGTLDKTGNYGDAQIYDSSGKLIFTYSEAAVNEYGKIISMKKFTSNGILQQTIINKYDKQIWIGGLIKDTSGKEIFFTIIRLNEKNDPGEVKEIMIRDGKPVTTITRYAYIVYDKYGNWTECKQIRDREEKESKILKRRITYWE